MILGVPVFARGHNDFVLQEGEGQNTIVKVIGKPDIITQDCEDTETWIYKDIKGVPVADITQSESIKKQKQSSILTIKFDNSYRVKSFGYMTTYFGENDD